MKSFFSKDSKTETKRFSFVAEPKIKRSFDRISNPEKQIEEIARLERAEEARRKKVKLTEKRRKRFIPLQTKLTKEFLEADDQEEGELSNEPSRHYEEDLETELEKGEKLEKSKKINSTQPLKSKQTKKELTLKRKKEKYDDSDEEGAIIETEDSEESSKETPDENENENSIKKDENFNDNDNHSNQTDFVDEEDIIPRAKKLRHVFDDEDE